MICKCDDDDDARICIFLEAHWASFFPTGSKNSLDLFSQDCPKTRTSSPLSSCAYLNQPMKILVTYSTQSGTSRKLAELFTHSLSGTFKEIGLCRINEVGNFDELQFVVFFVSTYGDGEPCDDGKQMYTDVEKISGVKYSIFGCGNSLYDAYQECAKQVDGILQKNKCERIGAFGMSDESNNRCIEEYENWMFDYTLELSRVFDVEFKYEDFKPIYEVSNRAPVQKSVSLRYHEDNPYGGEIDLESVEFFEDKRYVRFDLKLDKSMKYKTGDHVAVYPENRREDVLKLMKYLEPSDGIVNIKPITYDVDNPWKDLSAESLEVFLIKYVEINSRVTRTCVRELQQYVNKDDEKKLTSVNLSDTYITLWGLLESLNIQLPTPLPISFILQHFGPLNPRFYSIASAPNTSPNKVAVLLRNAEYGVCTSHVNSIINRESANGMRIYISKSKFKPPSVLSKKPVLLIGAGSGLAPYLGFLQDFSTRRGAIPSITLLLGARTHEFYRGLLHKYQPAPVNLNIHWAISRKVEEAEDNTAYPGSTAEYGCYVQDVLGNDTSLARCVTSESHIYLCGGAAMGAAVRRRLELLLGDGDARAGDRLLKKMVSLGRFQQDVW